jgi:murein DD-endopeptidase MepM/ murein hydrolase activator NlpD
MAKKQTTLIFIDNDQKIRNPVFIPTYLIENMRIIVLGFFVLVGTGIFTSFSSRKSYLYEQYKEVEVLSLKNKLDSAMLSEKYDSIVTLITDVNRLLIDKGIVRDTEETIDMDLTVNMPTEKDLTNLSEQLSDFKFNISAIPIGFPVDGSVSSSFGDRTNPLTGLGAESHRGLDFSAPHGTIVKNTASGKVIFSGRNGGYGNLVIVDHGQKYATYYGHLSEISVQKGQVIESNTVIGRVGSTGRSTGPHLHYEIRYNGEILNPIKFLTIN